jgi:hypothetical protein
MKNDLHYKKQDEYYTPKMLVQPIIQFLKKGSTVWCPFDKESSNYVILLKESGFNVVHSHIDESKDFFEYTPENYDYIVSNCPFSKKLDVLKKLYLLNKPFAVLFPLPCLNYQIIGNFFLDKKLQLYIPDKKVSFDGNTSSFNTCYFCKDVLPNDIMFFHLESNKATK